MSRRSVAFLCNHLSREELARDGEWDGVSPDAHARRNVVRHRMKLREKSPLILLIFAQLVAALRTLVTVLQNSHSGHPAYDLHDVMVSCSWFDSTMTTTQCLRTLSLLDARRIG